MTQKHLYYSEEPTFRKDYFEKQFFTLAQQRARSLGIPLTQYLSQITDKNTFVAVLMDAFSLDASLESYAEGMRNEDLDDFFNRPRIQNILEKGDEAKLPEIPTRVVQVEKKVRSLFPGRIKSKKTGKLERVVARKEFVKVKGKKQTRYRNLRTGRFASVK